MSTFDYIQTFYVNPDSVQSARRVLLTSVDLYFKTKPNLNTNVSGLASPGVTLWVVPVENNSPVMSSIIKNSVSRLEYMRINTSDNAESASVFSFASPILIDSGKFYAVVVKFDDPAFDLWYNKQGERLVSITGTTNTPSSGSQSRFDGVMYRSNIDAPLTDRDLKFRIKVAKFTANNTNSFTIVNRDYEFLTVGDSNFIGGELVYKNPASYETGNISFYSNSVTVTGTGTNFTSDLIGINLLLSNGSVSDLRKVSSVTNTTLLTLATSPALSSNGYVQFKKCVTGEVFYVNSGETQIVLNNSTAANSTFLFQANDTIIGLNSNTHTNIVSVDSFTIDKFTPRFKAENGTLTSGTISLAFTDANNNIQSSQAITNGFETTVSQTSKLLSRSTEVTLSGLHGTRKKSAWANVTFSSLGSVFEPSVIKNDELDLSICEYDINSNTSVTRYGITEFDSEVERNGTARSKYITKKVSFDENKFAEDIVIYLTAHRPAGTQIKVYAKLHNSADKDAFDDKAWSPLELKSNTNKYSSDNPNDLYEYSYGLPQWPETYSTLNGSFQSVLANTVVTASVDPSASVSAGDLVRIGQTLFPMNHEVFIVSSANTTSVTLNRPVSNNNIVGDVFMEKLKYKNVAWTNIANDNIAKYVSSSLVEFDTFNTMQIKVVLLSDSTHTVPKPKQLQVLGVSA